MTRPDESTLLALHLPDEGRTLIRKPKHGWAPRGTIETDVGSVSEGPKSWLVAVGRPTVITARREPYERTINYELKEGVSIPGIELPAVVKGFIEPDYEGQLLTEGRTDEKWEGLYIPVLEWVQPEPVTWTLDVHTVDWGLDHPDLIDCGWNMEPRAEWDEEPVFALWRPGYLNLDGLEWCLTQVEAMKLPGVTCYPSQRSLSVAVPTGERRTEHRTGARGQRLKAVYTRDLFITVRFEKGEFGIPSRVHGTDLLDASRKLRGHLAQLLDDIKDAVAVCPKCSGSGIVPRKKESRT